jgi:hypothetical protein
MPNKPIMIPGLDTPDHLRRWFEARGQRWLVLRVADILGLSDDDQDLVIQLWTRARTDNAWSGLKLDATNRRPWLQRVGAPSGGYLRLRVDLLCASLSIEELQAVQAMLAAYRDVRQCKGEPSVDSWCECTEGGRRAPQRGCPTCGGGGKVTVLVELTEEEQRLAEGQQGD